MPTVDDLLGPPPKTAPSVESLLGDKPPESESSLSGVIGSVTRGLAPIAAGAGVGAALGAPLAGVGAIPGAAAGGAAVGLTQLAGALYRPLADKLGWPEMTTPQEMTDRVLDAFGVKKPSTPLERMAETTAGGAAGGLGAMRGAAELAGSLASPVAKGVATQMAKNPALATLSGGTGAAAGQGAAELGFGPVGQMVAQLAGGALPYGAGVHAQEPLETSPAKLQAKARNIIAKSFAEYAAAGGPSASDLLDQFSAARAEGQPLTLVDVGGKGVERLAGSVYRSKGGAGTILENFYKTRDQQILDDTLDTAAGARVSGLVNRYLSTGSAKQTAKALAAMRSQNAKPLWDKAMEGGSIAPLEQHFETAFNEASKAEQEAAKRVAQAEQAVTAAKGKQKQTGGNVYAASAANRAQRQAEAQLIEAHQAQARARDTKAAVTERLRQAQSDRTLDAKGAVWSPRLQEYLDKDIFREGLKRGMAIEDLAATNEGRPFNPHEYAIVGTEPDGSPKIGSVPNMKLLQMAKEGLDAMLFEDSRLRDPLTGRLTKMGREVNEARAQFLAEADRLNPAWKPAREQWAGDTANIRAVQEGKKALDSAVGVEDVADRFSEMTESEKEFYRVGVADEVRRDIDNKQLTADETKTFLNTPAQLKKLRVIFPSKDAFDKFVAANVRERAMYEKPRRIMQGSQTAERMTSDSQHLLHAARGLAHLLHGNYGYGLHALGSMMRERGNPALNEEMARVLSDPSLSLTVAQPSGQLTFGIEEALKRAQQEPRP